MTELVFRDEPYAQDCEARVVAVNDRGGVVLDRTVFYPTGGGQPGDSGVLRLADGGEIRIATAVKGDAPDEVVHVPAEGQDLPAVGADVTAAIDWERRYRHMRMHTCLHLLSAALPYAVTGGQIGADKSRLDFNIEDPSGLDKQEITDHLNRMVEADHSVATSWISDEDLQAKPDLVKTMSVKPPMGSGRVRLIRIGDIDLQPCGGTHVARTGEIGRVKIAKIENKGAKNRRVRVAFDEV
ncbi:MAG: alanyl-tRNA editing protein [Minwuiales bacterium]|nr:alanyl-tRNA editing protein [Minwuiales bacterium]